MPRYYCDYCDTYLTHDSPSVRKQHNAGYKHKANVRAYYQQFEEQQTQSLIDQRIKEHLGQAAAFQHQVGATYNQHLMSMPGNRPPLPVLGPPILPMGAPSQGMLPGVRPPLLPHPVVGAPGYGPLHTMPTVPPSALPPGAAASAPMQVSNLPRPPQLTPPISGAMSMPTTNGAAPAIINPVMYQPNPSSTTTGSFDSFNAASGSG